MKDVTYKRIGLFLIGLSTLFVLVVMTVIIAKLVPPAIDAAMDHQRTMSMQSRGVEDIQLVGVQR